MIKSIKYIAYSQSPSDNTSLSYFLNYILDFLHPLPLNFGAIDLSPLIMMMILSFLAIPAFA